MSRFGRVLAVLFIACLLAPVAKSLLAAGELGAVEPSDEEQFGIWTLNRARHDPAAYGEAIGVNLSALAPQPPLAVSKLLTGSSRFHAQEMLDHNYFAHTSAVTGEGPNQMAADNGYDVFGAGLGNDWGTTNNIESIAKGIRTVATYEAALSLLVVDKGVPGFGHRVHLLATSAFYQKHREIGCGRAAKGQTFVYAIHTAYVAQGDLFLTGVVYDDRTHAGAYDEGEGMGGVTVDAGGGRTTTTMASGGWSIPVPPGTYTVTCSGGPFVGTATSEVTVGAANREVDFRSGFAHGVVDFDVPAAPALRIAASVVDGPAPLAVDFNATGAGAGVALDWDFGDGATSATPALTHEFTAPGLYTVRLHGTNDGGTGGAIGVISVTGAAGAGPGTTLPASAALTTSALKIKTTFGAAAASSVQFTARFSMPAGWTPGLSDAIVDVAGVRFAFPLGTKDSATAPSGSKFALKYKKPKAGAPLGAGVTATLTVSLTGDLAGVLADLGLRDAAETRTLTGVPVAVMLGEAAWRGDVSLAVTSKAGVKSSAKLTP